MIMKIITPVAFVVGFICLGIVVNDAARFVANVLRQALGGF